MVGLSTAAGFEWLSQDSAPQVTCRGDGSTSKNTSLGKSFCLGHKVTSPGVASYCDEEYPRRGDLRNRLAPLQSDINNRTFVYRASVLQDVLLTNHIIRIPILLTTVIIAGT